MSYNGYVKKRFLILYRKREKTDWLRAYSLIKQMVWI